MSDIAKRVILTIPMYPDMELAAAQTATVLAELMDFGEGEVEEIQLAIIETCINAFEHSKSDDQDIHIEFVLMEGELQFKVTDRGVGISPDTLDGSRVLGSPGLHTDLRKRGRGLQIIRSLMDEVDIESSPNGTTVSVIKKKKG